MNGYLELLFTVLAVIACVVVLWLYSRGKPARQDFVAINFENYKCREESDRQTRTGW